MLEMRVTCEACSKALEPSGEAFICSYECSYCKSCYDRLQGVCPNCQGELCRRPKRNS